MKYLFRGISGMVLALALVLLAAFTAGWSGWFIQPVSIKITPSGTVFVRHTPFGNVNAEWVMEVTTADARECEAARGKSIIQRVPADTVRLGLPEVVRPCVVPGAVAQISYTVKIFGIELRPIYVTTIVEQG